VDVNRTGCDPGIDGGCCARSLLASQPDFQAQKGRLEEEVEAHGHSVIFYPKFHCELNFIERFWCAAKFYARENCGYSFNKLRETVPAALDSVSSASINRYYHHCMRIMAAYRDRFSYGTKEFTERIYKGHRQIVDRSKWNGRMHVHN